MIRFAAYSWSELLLCASTLEVDRLGFDIVNTSQKVCVGCRVLFTEIDYPGRFYDATIRWSRKSGAETERDKLPRGELTGLVYAYPDPDKKLARLVSVKPDPRLAKKRQDGGLIHRTPWNKDWANTTRRVRFTGSI